MAHYDKALLIARLESKKKEAIERALALTKNVETQFDEWKQKQIEYHEEQLKQAGVALLIAKSRKFGTEPAGYNQPKPVVADTTAYDSMIAELGIIVDPLISLQPSSTILKLIR